MKTINSLAKKITLIFFFAVFFLCMTCTYGSLSYNFCATNSLSFARPTAFISGSGVICSGETIVLTLAVTGAGTISGTLSDGSGFSGTAPTILVSKTPLSSIIYTVASLSDANGTAQASDMSGAANIIVNARPTGAISGSSTICSGQSLGIPISITGNGSINGTLSDGTAFSGTPPLVYAYVSPGTNKTYTLATLTDAGCAAQSQNMTGSHTVNVNPALTNYHTVFYEDFDSLNFLPAGWLSSPAYYWNCDWSSSSTGYIGASGVSNAIAHNNDPLNTSLISPAIDFSSQTNAKLTFGLRKTATFARNLIVEVSTDNFSTIAFTKTIFNANFPTATYWGLQTINLGNYIDHAPSVKIRWRLSGGPGGGVGNIRIDDITLSSAIPTISHNGPLAICPGENLILTSSTGNTYLWSPNNETTQSIIVTTPGIYSVQINGCAMSQSVGVTANSNGTTGISIAASENPICEGTSVNFSSVSLNEGTNPIYQWSVNGVNAGANSPDFSYVPSNNDIIRCTLTSSSTCIYGNPATSNTLTMVVNDTPSIINVIPGSICGAGSVILSAQSSSGTIRWYDMPVGGNLLGSGSIFTTAVISSTTTYYAEASNEGCKTITRSPVIAYVNELPQAVSVYGGGNQCGGSMNLSTSGGEGGSIYWQGTVSGGNSIISAATSMYVASSGTYYFRSFSDHGCWGPEGSATVLIKDIPEAPSGNPVQSFCGASTVADLQANGVNIQWYNVVTAGSPLPSATSLFNGNYYYASQKINGCESISRLHVTSNVFPIPSVNLYPDLSVCKGTTSTHLNIITSTGNPVVFSINYDNIANNSGFVDVINDSMPNDHINIVIPPGLHAGIYHAILKFSNGSNGSGCSSVDYPFSLSVDTVFRYSEEHHICNGEVYNWHHQNLNMAGTYYDFNSSANGCDSTYILNLSINQEYSFTENFSMCSGKTHLWHGQLLTTNGVYHANYISKNGCDSIYTLNLTVFPKNEYTESHSICNGDVYHWHGQNLSNSGIYFANYTNTFGCDSISYTLHLTVHPAYSFTEYHAISSGDNYLWHAQSLTTGGIYTAHYLTLYGCDSTYTLYLTEIRETKSLSIRVFLEGLYDGDGLMHPSLGLSGTQFGAGIADQVIVSLNESVSPYLPVFTSGNINLYNNGLIQTIDLTSAISGSYYIVIRHRNSITTWSALPVNFSLANTIDYDFTLSAGQAYGSNQKKMDAYYALWGGNIIQDAVIDGSDLAAADNASIEVLMGYYAEDVNGDGVVDGSDMALTDNNSIGIVRVIQP